MIRVESSGGGPGKGGKEVSRSEREVRRGRGAVRGKPSRSVSVEGGEHGVVNKVGDGVTTGIAKGGKPAVMVGVKVAQNE